MAWPGFESKQSLSLEPWRPNKSQEMDADTRRKLTYGAGIVAGVVVVSLVKKVVRKIPVVGAVLRPFLFLVPTILVGPALGASAVMAIEEDDVMAGPKAAQRALVHVREQAGEYVHGLRKEIETTKIALERESARMGDVFTDFERTMVRAQQKYQPLIEEDARAIQRQLDLSLSKYQHA